MMRALNIILLGGDRREIELYHLWRNDGLNVSLAGFEHHPLAAVLIHAKENAFQQAQVMIAPLSGIKAPGTVAAAFSAESPLNIFPLLKMPYRKYLLLTGTVAPEFSPLLPQQALPLFTAEDNELALLNAVPTAEGAIQKAMELSAVTIHGSRVLVVGLGRCGTVLARMLQGLGARVSAIVRRSESAALAATMLIEAYFSEQIEEIAGSADYIFNTVPAPILTASVLQKVKPGAVILDLASNPGGTDFQAAAELGLQAVLLPGLPGKRAPLSAARILDRVYRRLIIAGMTKL